MPLIVHSPAAEVINTPVDESVDAVLFDKDGNLTLEGQVIEAFIASIDWNDLLDDEDVAEFIESEVKRLYFDDEAGLAFEELDETSKEEFLARMGKGKKKGKGDDKAKDDEKEDDKEDDADDEDDGTEEGTIETLDGEIVAEFVDEADLEHMFLHYVSQLPESNLAEKAQKAAIIKHLDLSEEELVEFKRGAFAKARKTGAGKNKVTRMLMAMLAKQAIARAKPGQASYRAPGAKSTTYTKAGQRGAGDNLNPTGKVSYGTGTTMGRKKYFTHVSTGASKSAAGQMKSKSKKKQTASEIRAAALKAKKGTTSMKAAAKSGDAKKKAKADVLAKKKPSGKGANRKMDVAHDEKAVSHIHEGSKLASHILGALPRAQAAPINEVKAK